MVDAYESAERFEEARINAAAVYCSDGRFGEPVDEFLHQGLGLPRYDRVAVPGGPACLAGRLLGFWEARGVEDQLRFLVLTHALTRVVLIMHDLCGFYVRRLGIPPAEVTEAQNADLVRAARVVDGLGAKPVAYRASVVSGRVRFKAVPLS